MSVGFDPVKVGAKRRRIDPLMVGVVAVVIALAVAVVKPWEAGADTATLGPPVALATPPSAAPTARVAQTATPTGGPPPTWAEVAPAIRAHDGWGVRAIVAGQGATVGSGASPRYEERWSETSADPDGIDTAHIITDDQPVVALGITAPFGLAPQDARIWRVHSTEELEWIDARPLQQDDPDGGFLFLRFGPAGFQAWAAGHYRVDVLVDDAVQRIAVQIPGRSRIVPFPDDWPATEANLVGPEASDPSAVRIGPFATVGGVGVPLAATAGPLMGVEEAWLDVIGQTPDSQPPRVASAYLPRATGLGVMLTPHAGIRLAIVRRISPDGRLPAQPMLGGISARQGGTPYVVFAPRGGGAWPPGVYAITIRWTDAASLRVETWHVELRPGPLQYPVPTR